MRKTAGFFLRWLEVFLGLGGLALLFWMIQKIGFDTILQSLSRFGLLPALFLIALYTLAQLCFCGAWHVLLQDGPGKTLKFWEIFLVYSAGDALNMTVPSGNLAGEPVKVMMIRDKVSLQTALTSVTVYKYSDILSMTLFLTLGWLNHFAFYKLPLSWNVGAGVVAGGMSALCVLLYFLQHRGIYRPAGEWLGKIGLGKWLEKKLESAPLLDSEIAAFYREHPYRFAASVFLNFLAWFGGVIEIVIFMKVSGIPVSFAAALTIETFSLFINNVIFFVPARLGVGEGGRVLLFLTLGYSPHAGMSYGILRRIRELAWIGLGFLILTLRKNLVKMAETGAKPS